MKHLHSSKRSFWGIGCSFLTVAYSLGFFALLLFSGGIITGTAMAEEEEALGSKPGMGMPDFDANQMSRFQVNETNGNVVVTYNLMTIPNPRGQDIEIFLTYNSQNFHSYSVTGYLADWRTGEPTEDPPAGMIGNACWTFSRAKKLKTESLYRVEDIGSWGDIGIDISVGDVLIGSDACDWDEPNWTSTCSDLHDQIEDLRDAIELLDDNLADEEKSLGEYEAQKKEIWNISIPELQEEINKLNEQLEELSSQYETMDEYCGNLEDEYAIWSNLNAQPNWERDGGDAWMPQEDWEVYVGYGGNDGFYLQDELDSCPDQLNEIQEQGGEINDAILDIESQIIALEAQISNVLDPAIDQLRQDIPQHQQQLVDTKKNLDELDQLYEYYDDLSSNFENISCSYIGDSAIYESGDGDAWTLLQSCWSPQSNPYHIGVNFGYVSFKDGSRFVSGGGVGGPYIVDRYNNVTFLTGQVIPGRWVEFSNENEAGLDIVISSGSEDRCFHLVLNQGNLVSITNPSDEETIFEYYPIEHWNATTGISSVRWDNSTGVPESFDVRRCLLKTITEPNDCETHFEYEDVDCIYGDFKDIWERPRRCTRVYKDDGQSIINDTRYCYNTTGDPRKPSPDDTIVNVIITDSRSNITVKNIDRKQYEVDDEGQPVLDKDFVKKIIDPHGGETEYCYENMSLELESTEDTNNLVHNRTYDEIGNLLEISTTLNGTPIETNYTYEEYYSQVTSIEDAEGHIQEYYYVTAESDEHGPVGVMWKEIDRIGQENEHWYNEYGQRIRTLDPRGIVTTYGYGDTYYYLSSVKVYEDYPGGDYFEKTITHDGFGNKLFESDYNGNLTEYTYDALNRLTSETVHDGGDSFVTTYYYTTFGKLDRKVDPRGAVSKYEYDGFGRLIKVYEAYGTNDQTLKQFAYDSEDNKIEEIDPNGHHRYFVYDALNRLIEESRPCGSKTTYVYSGSGDSSTNGGSYRYDRSKDRYTQKTVFNRNYSGKEEYLVTQYVYDGLYRLVEEIDPLGKSKDYEYDYVGNKTAEVDRNEHRTEYEYYDDNSLKKVIDPNQNYEEYWYDGVGNKIQVRDKRGNNAYSSYDALSRMTCQTDPEGGATYVVWDGMNKIAERDKNGNWTEFSYNGRNLLTDIYFPISGISSSIAYDANGNKEQETDPNGNIVKYEYDLLDRQTRETKGYGVLNLETLYSYDDNGNRTSITDAEGNTTAYSYNYLDLLITVDDPIYSSIRATGYDYDLLGNKIRVTDKNGNSKEYSYDENSRLTSTLNEKGVEETFEYDNEGNRTQWINGNGDSITYEYDALNRLTKKSYSPASFVEFSYDAAGNRISMTDANGTTAYTYDDVNRLLSESSPGPNGNRTVSYTYYPNGERATMTAPGSRVTEYEYDAMNRLVSITDSDDGETTYEFDAGSRLTEMEYPNGVVARYDNYDAADRLVHMWTADSTATATFTEFSYTYDAVGNRTQVVDVLGTTTFTYDDLYRLTGAAYPDTSTATYYYDPVGNRLREIVGGVEKNYVYNELNQLVAWTTDTVPLVMDYTVTGTAYDNDGLLGVWVNGTEASFAGQTWAASVTFTYGTNVISVSAWDQAGNVSSSDREVYYRPGLATFMEYFYDDNGCLIEKIANDDTVNIYEYTPENRLVKVTLTDNSTCEYTYDGDLRQVARKKPDGSETWFLHDGVNILMDQATDGTPWAYYNQGIGIDKMISVVEWAGQTEPQKRYYHSDAIGSVRSMTDDDGSQVQTYAYDAWGNIIASSGTEANEYKFTSRRWESELGIQYNRARFYDPNTGRFISPDPLTGGPDDPTISYFSGVYFAFHRFLKGYVDAMQPHKFNRYAYCFNNPVSHIDPLGLNAEHDSPKVQPPDPAPAPLSPLPPATSSSEPSVSPDTSNPGTTSNDVINTEGIDDHQGQAGEVNVDTSENQNIEEDEEDEENANRIITINEYDHSGDADNDGYSDAWERLIADQLRGVRYSDENIPNPDISDPEVCDYWRMQEEIDSSRINDLDDLPDYSDPSGPSGWQL